MPLSHLFRKFSQPSLESSGSADGGRNSEHSDDSSQPVTEPKATSRSWRKKKASSVNRPTSPESPPPISALPLTASSKSAEPDVGVLESPMPMPLPTAPDIFVTNLALMPQPETMPTISPVSDTLAKTWDMVKDGPKDSGGSRTLTIVGKPET